MLLQIKYVDPVDKRACAGGNHALWRYSRMDCHSDHQTIFEVFSGFRVHRDFWSTWHVTRYQILAAKQPDALALEGKIFKQYKLVQTSEPEDEVDSYPSSSPTRWGFGSRRNRSSISLREKQVTNIPRTLGNRSLPTKPGTPGTCAQCAQTQRARETLQGYNSARVPNMLRKP